jgi:Rhs element Vgr protein
MPNNRSIPENAKGSTVTFTLKIEGQTIPKTFEVHALTVVKEVNRIPTAKISMIDGDPSKEKFEASDADVFVPGKTVELFVGHQGQEDLIFKGIIVKHSISARSTGASQLKLECKDKAFKMTLGRKSKYFKDMKDSDVASDIASPYGLNPDIEDTSIKQAQLVQYDSCDWDFLMNRMEVNGKVVLVNDGTLAAKAPSFSGSPVLTLQYGATIHEFDAEMDARTQYAAVKAMGWDAGAQELLEVDAKEPSGVKENGNIKAGQLAEVTGLDGYTLRFAGSAPQQELQSWADACWQKSRMAKIRGRVRFGGFAKIKPGDLVTLQGVGDRFNGDVWVSGVRHDVAQGGWTTDVQFGLDPEWFSEKFSDTVGSNGASLHTRVQGLHSGIVTQLEKDPAGEDRILVKIPVIDFADDGIWARMCTLDAGKNRGSFFRPDLGDEVLVGFLADASREAVVLGMLNSSAKPAPLLAKDDNKEKGFFFASEMKILFNEEDKSMAFETPGGNKFIISEKDKSISMQDQNGNKLMLNKDGITLESSKKLILKASSGDIEMEGMNVKQKASAQFKAEGSAGVEVSSSAVAVLKGSLVQIN